MTQPFRFAPLLAGWAFILACGLTATVAHAADATLLVLHKKAESLGFYDRTSGKLLASVPVGTVPHEMVVSADHRFAYVTNYGVGTYTDKDPGGNTVSIVDLVRREKVGEIGLGVCRRPHGIELGRSGRLYVTVDNPGSLLVIDPDKRTVIARHDVGSGLPHMVTVTKDETKAWVANAGAGTVTAVRFGPPVRLATIAVGGVPMGMALSRDGRQLYATTRGGNEVVVIDTATDAVLQRIPVVGEPARLLFTRDEKQLLVSLMVSGEVAVLDPRSRREVSRFKVGKAPEGLALDEGNGFGFVSAQNDARVVKFALGDFHRVLDIATAEQPDPLIVLDEVKP